MERRRFILASGSALLGSEVASSRPSVALQFKLSGSTNINPSNVNSLILRFEELSIIPEYVDESEDAEISVSVKLGTSYKESKNTTVGVQNGRAVTLEDIPSFNRVKLSNITLDSDLINGDVEVRFTHSSVEENYSQSFIITESTLNSIIHYYAVEGGDKPLLKDGYGNKQAYKSGPNWSSDTIVGNNSLKFGGETTEENIVSTLQSNKLGTDTTFCFWIKPTGTQNRTVTLSGYGGGANRWFIEYNYGDKKQVWWQEWDSSTNISSNGLTAPLNEWTHIAVTHSNNDEVKIYLDGEFANRQSISRTLNIDQPLRFGYNPNHGGFDDTFDGYLDELRIYDSVLDQSEISTIRDRTSPSGEFITESNIPSQNDGGFSKWSFNGDLVDSWGSLDGSGSGGFESGVYGKAKSFDGSADNVVTGNTSVGDGWSEISFGGWIKDRNADSDYGLIAGRDITGGSSGDVFALVDDSNGEWSWRIRTPNGQGIVNSSKISNTWTHVFGTYDGSVQKIFVNGVEVESSNISGSLVSENTEFYIGSYSDDALYWKGAIDDLRLYDRALSSKEVYRIYMLQSNLIRED